MQPETEVTLFSMPRQRHENASLVFQSSKERMQSMLDTQLPLSYGGFGNTCASFDSMTYSSFLQVTT